MFNLGPCARLYVCQNEGERMRERERGGGGNSRAVDSLLFCCCFYSFLYFTYSIRILDSSQN